MHRSHVAPLNIGLTTAYHRAQNRDRYGGRSCERQHLLDKPHYDDSDDLSGVRLSVLSAIHTKEHSHNGPDTKTTQLTMRQHRRGKRTFRSDFTRAECICFQCKSGS